MAETGVEVFHSEEEMACSLAAFIQNVITLKRDRPGRLFRLIGLSGGSMIGMLAKALPMMEVSQWDQIRFVFCDERLVAPSHPDSNFGAASKALIGAMGDHYGFDMDLFVPVDHTLEPACAADYETKLDGLIAGGNFDLLLLGVGPDGHTCSLFPNGAALQRRDEQLVAGVTDSPKPPARRVTLTLRALNERADHVAFIATGAGKAAVIREVLDADRECSLPARLVRPTAGELRWFLDDGAASQLDLESK